MNFDDFLIDEWKRVRLGFSVPFTYQSFHRTNDERRAYLTEIAKVSIQSCFSFKSNYRTV